MSISETTSKSLNLVTIFFPPRGFTDRLTYMSDVITLGLMLNITRQKTLIIFLAITIALTAFLFYTVYVWTGVAALFYNFDQNLIINNVEVSAGENPRLISMTMTITNSFAGSFIDLYVEVRSLYINNTQALFFSGSQPFPGTFGSVQLAPLSSKSLDISFSFSADSSFPQNITGQQMIFSIRVLAKTVVNENPMTINLLKLYSNAS
jgi:hypothetical protein